MMEFCIIATAVVVVVYVGAWHLASRAYEINRRNGK